MTDTRQRAIDLVEAALVPEQDHFSMDDIFDELEEDMSETIFEPDARILAEKWSDYLNFYAVHDYELDGNTHYGPENLPEAMTADLDPAEKIRERSLAEMQSHREHESEDRVEYVDLRRDSDRNPLPEWNRHDPNQQNVVRGLIAGRPGQLYVLRGEFTPLELRNYIYTGEIIKVGCNVNMSRECEPKPVPLRNYRATGKGGIFTRSVGETIIYWVCCPPCYRELFEKDGAYFDVS